jgi:hypothetical protein
MNAGSSLQPGGLLPDWLSGHDGDPRHRQRNHPKHDPEKSAPVFGQDHTQIKGWRRV